VNAGQEKTTRLFGTGDLGAQGGLLEVQRTREIELETGEGS
jgi:hypothetical protein